jgi:hypothetical protein
VEAKAKSQIKCNLSLIFEDGGRNKKQLVIIQKQTYPDGQTQRGSAHLFAINLLKNLRTRRRSVAAEFIQIICTNHLHSFAKETCKPNLFKLFVPLYGLVL